MVPHGLPIGKVEIVNITCDVLAGDEQRSQVSPCSGPKLHRKKKRRRRKMARRQRRRKNCGEKGRERKGRREERINTKLKGRDFPDGPVVKNPPSNAGDVGSIPGQGTKIPHASGQLSPRATTREPVRPGARMPQLERSSCAATKSPHHNKDPVQPKLKK